MKKIAVINDLSGFGKCSLTAAIPVLSVQGVQACPLPTAVLSNQTGYPDYCSVDFTENLPSFISQWKKLEPHFDGILTGFVSDIRQIKIIEDFCRDFKKDDTILMVDPVMADNGKVYPVYSPELCEEVKRLALMADIITPNLTEFCVLTDTDYDEIMLNAYKDSMNTVIFEKAKPLFENGIKTVIVTSVPVTEGYVTNCIVTPDGVENVSSRIFEGSFSGTGDLFASVVCGAVVKGESVYDAVCRAARFLEASLSATVCECTRPEDGICFEPFLKLL
ncbi:MAG: pyridoxamine kinase [Clostridia bacterium]|nr:pyridoxamine kinase [Clostridia bacterium]